jgi:hypothetical protein
VAFLEVNWQPDRKALRQFGVAMLVGFGIIGAVAYAVADVDQPVTPLVLWGFGLVAGLLGLSGTRAALPIYWFWMALAFVVGGVMGRVLIAAVFYLVITPYGLLLRAIGRDRLQLRRPGSDTYWHPIKPPVESPDYERQF